MAQRKIILFFYFYHKIFKIYLFSNLCIEQTLNAHTYQSLSNSSSIEPNKETNDQKYFIYHALRYFWNAKTQKFEKLLSLDNTITCNNLLQEFKGFSSLIQKSK